MPRTRIKICGITRRQDAIAAAEAGADSIGLILHAPSKRRIPLKQAAEIVAGLPPFMATTGLFVDAPPEVIREAAAALRLSFIQLHGHEPVAAVNALSPLNVIKVIHVKAETLEAELRLWKESKLPNLSGLLLDNAAGGGSGIPNDFDAIEQNLRVVKFTDQPRIVIAGGLDAENVGAVIQRLRPWAVDLCSGVESRPGEKSIERIREFVAAVREADLTGKGNAPSPKPSPGARFDKAHRRPEEGVSNQFGD